MLRAERLAADFAALNEELISLLLGLDEEQWAAPVADEEGLRSVGQVAVHVARAHLRINERVLAIAGGGPARLRQPQMFAERNRREAENHPRPDQKATIELLRQNGEQVRSAIARLGDADLDRPGEEEAGIPTTALEVIEQRQLGHVRSHLQSLRVTGSGLSEHPL